MREFTVIRSATARKIIDGDRRGVVATVRDAYLAHDRGDTVNPSSHFLRFPDRPAARIIALPAYVGGDVDVAGIKWIASVSDNVSSGMPRASAVLLLNDPVTGYAFACIEASVISAARTAASAVLAAETLTGSTSTSVLGFVGAGFIARTVLDFFTAQGWSIGDVVVHDREPAYAAALTEYAGRVHGLAAHHEPDLAAALRAARVLVLATTAAEPYIGVGVLTLGQLVLNISLRDLAPEVLLDASNIVDDVDHCLTAGTSPHLAEQLSGNRDFLDGTLAEVIRGVVQVRRNRPVVFSPFGLGVLDVAVGARVHAAALASGEAISVNDFFTERRGW